MAAVDAAPLSPFVTVLTVVSFAAVDAAPLSAQDSLAAGLIDSVLYTGLSL